MKGKYWTTAEERLLRDVWLNPGPVKLLCAHFPGRTPKSLVQRAADMGLGPRNGIGKCTYSYVRDEIDKLLSNGRPLSVYTIADITGMKLNSVMSMIIRGKKSGHYYIAGYERYSITGVWRNKYLIGPGEDVPKPKKKTGAENCRNYRLRKKVRTNTANNPFERLAA